ncbi:C6 transcription factor-like protein [Macroventuria anomochaeta]|uniref:C6 transcription factor-like protein n=1 Tax=Macroventuria anomochaeta TaxID=301207 RepID=A0ACB6RTI1_9PLEO|nr:C6 transcription factor-like protein [Macroventuria anomochaeta]KAF2624217.1 C6 transcription factor-like protein [Macroventuria anomochaeta]
MPSTPIYLTNFATPLAQRKVAIPRLQRPSQGQNGMKDRRRVPRACTACRSHKIKCTGERPHCKHCATTNRECVYIMPRKDRLKIVMERCQQMASLLKGLRSCANADDDARIADLLEAVEEEISGSRRTTAPSIPDTDANGSQESHELGALDHQDGLDTESLGLLDEDLHINDRARATGFVGKNSEVQWLRAVTLAQSEQTDDEAGALHRQGSYAPGIGNEQISSYSFWTDSESVDIDFFVDPYDLPPLETAERLLGCYISKVHDSFPILPRKTFEDQFRKYFTALQNGNAPRLSPMWQAILNLVFAIGAKYSHLSKASWRADERDHLIYQARARAFGLNEFTLTRHSDVPQIQSLGLLGFYWLSIGQVSRAWTVIGIALRFAYTLGLHVRNEDPSATAVKRETLVRTWWSLYSLERTLSIVTGRPSIIVDSCCSVPLPIPVTEEQISDQMEAAYRMRKRSSSLISTPQSWSSGIVDPPRTPMGLGTTEANSGSYFKAAVQLSIITQNILTSLYTASTITRSAAENQHEMAQLGQRLDQWVLSLPREFNFQEPINSASMAFSRERMLLAFPLCGARMLLGRLCLNPRRQAWREGNEATFARRMGNSCIEAAKMVVDFLPDEPNAHFIYDQGPWWCIVHHMMQAVSVFLLGLSYPTSTSQDSMLLIYYVKKVIRWLQVMQDPVAERAYQVAMSSFETVSRRYPAHVAGIWRMESAHGSDIQQHALGPSMTAYLPAQVTPDQFVPQDIAVATYVAYDAVSTGATFPAHNGIAVYSNSDHTAR